MTKTSKSGARSISERKQAHARMLKAALARPGVKEVMRVYGNWREKDRGFDSYRSATKRPVKTITTNSSSAG